MHSIPKILPAKEVNIVGYEKINLESGIPCFGFNGVPYDIINIDLVFNAGRWTEKQPLASSFLSKTFKAGTTNKNAEQIAESIDFLGGTIRINQGYNSFTISLYCITKNLEDMLKILQELIVEANFPEHKVSFNKEKTITGLKINRQKAEFQADEAFKKMIYGDSHPYGYSMTEQRIKDVSRDSILAYFKENLIPKNLSIYVSGKYDNTTIGIINKYINNTIFPNTIVGNFDYKAESSKEMKQHIKLPKIEQASLIIGKQIDQPTTSGFYDFAVLNTILGGYFGSRLMKNIREDKGYTYGISSEIINFKHSSVWTISTEVGLDYVKPCIEEIYKEIQLLKTKKVGYQELDRVRNYMMGKMLRYFDGPFNTKNAYMTFWNTNRDIEHVTYIINSIKNVTSKRLQELANTHFDEESFYEVLVD